MGAAATRKRKPVVINDMDLSALDRRFDPLGEANRVLARAQAELDRRYSLRPVEILNEATYGMHRGGLRVGLEAKVVRELRRRGPEPGPRWAELRDHLFELMLEEVREGDPVGVARSIFSDLGFEVEGSPRIERIDREWKPIARRAYDEALERDADGSVEERMEGAVWRLIADELWAQIAELDHRRLLRRWKCEPAKRFRRCLRRAPRTFLTRDDLDEAWRREGSFKVRLWRQGLKRIGSYPVGYTLFDAWPSIYPAGSKALGAVLIRASEDREAAKRWAEAASRRERSELAHRARMAGPSLHHLKYIAKESWKYRRPWREELLRLGLRHRKGLLDLDPPPTVVQ